MSCEAVVKAGGNCISGEFAASGCKFTTTGSSSLIHRRTLSPPAFSDRLPVFMTASHGRYCRSFTQEGTSCN